MGVLNLLYHIILSSYDRGVVRRRCREGKACLGNFFLFFPSFESFVLHYRIYFLSILFSSFLEIGFLVCNQVEAGSRWIGGSIISLQSFTFGIISVLLYSIIF